MALNSERVAAHHKIFKLDDMQNDDDTIITCGIQNYLIENLIRYSIFSRIVSKIGGGITREYNYFEER